MAGPQRNGTWSCSASSVGSVSSIANVRPSESRSCHEIRRSYTSLGGIPRRTSSAFAIATALLNTTAITFTPGAAVCKSQSFVNVTARSVRWFLSGSASNLSR